MLSGYVIGMNNEKGPERPEIIVMIAGFKSVNGDLWYNQAPPK